MEPAAGFAAAAAVDEPVSAGLVSSRRRSEEQPALADALLLLLPLRPTAEPTGGSDDIVGQAIRVPSVGRRVATIIAPPQRAQMCGSIQSRSAEAWVTKVTSVGALELADAGRAHSDAC